MRFALIKLVFLNAMLGQTYGYASAQSLPESTTRINPRDLLIEIMDDTSDLSSDESRCQILKACESFSVYLTKNRGLWGSGPFRDATCKITNLQKDGAQSETNELKRALDWRWHLRVQSKDTQKTFEVFYNSKRRIPSTIATFSLATEINLKALLEKHNFAQLIAARLTNDLPIRSAITGNRIIQGQAISIKGHGRAELPLTAQSVQIYGLRRLNDTWIPKLVATGEINFDLPNKTTITIKSVEKNPIDQSALVNRKSIYFMHQINSANENSRKIEDALRANLGTFFSKFLNIGRSAYIGARYGVPAQKGKGVLANVKMLGLFGEFRGGALSGLKMNYDVIPKETLTSAESTDEFSWSRVQLGYGFGFRIENNLINWIDVTPKIGVTNLLLKSSPTENALTDGYEFQLQRAPTVGVEIGLEKRTNAFLVRLWGYGSYSLGVLPIDKEYKSTTLRGGIDVYKELIDWKAVKLAVLLFTTMDRNQYTRLLSDEELANNPNMTTEVKYGSLLAGGGITLTW